MNATTTATTTRAKGLFFTATLLHGDIPGLDSVTSFFQFRSTGSFYLFGLQGKAVQERKPIRNQSKASDHEQNSQRNQQGAAGYFQGVHLGAEAAIEL